MNLDSPITELPNVGPIFAKKFQKLGVNTIENLFYHAPAHYLDYSLVTTINKLRANEVVTIHAKIVSITNISSKRGIRMQIGSVEDTTGKVMVVWFNQQFLTRTLYPGRLVSLSGKVSFFNRKLCLSSPDYELIESEDSQTVHTGHLIPVYPETFGLSSKWIRRIVLTAHRLLTTGSTGTEEFIPKSILTRRELVSLEEAFEKLHFPKTLEDVEVARKRLAFNEMLFLQLKSMKRKISWKKNKVTKKLSVIDSSMNRFVESLPFKLTNSQLKAIKEILNDMSKDTPMNRLLEGDVGSGKTVVAAIGAFVSFTNGYQSIFMAPTQILAEQHFKTLKNIFDPFNIKVSLITSSVENIEKGRTDIYVGTHSLIHSKIDLKQVSYVVIDEQHRFGVEQRTHLVQKVGLPDGSQGIPHVLTMTATPIPRTIALTTYGDLELSVLTEVPVGRQKIKTWFVPDTKRKGAYEWVEKKVMSDKSQVFVVCPLIEESDKETMEGVKAASAEFSNLKSQFPKLKLGLLHGRMKATEKNKTLDDFRNGKTSILVATPVVEVGIDIPNATIMVVEAAERFGLAQLHQLRGRVGRGNKKSYCLLFSNIKYSKRLRAMEKMHSGFELAELDLKLRGPGEIFGTAQSGFAELKIANWSDVRLIKKTKEVAEDVFKNPTKYPILSSRLTKLAETN